MEVVFVRHGTPDYSLADARQMSQLEKDYAPLERSCIPDLQQQANSEVFHHAEIIISSPYTRALQTAEILNRTLHLDLFVEHDLREWRAEKSGGYLSLQERDRRWHEYRTSLRDSKPMVGTAYETIEDLSTRVKSVLERYTGHHKVVMVSHFNVLESVMGYQEQGIDGFVKSPKTVTQTS